MRAERRVRYWRSRPNCTDGRSATRVAGLMIFTTLSPILPSCWWRGIGCAVTRGRARPGWTARPPLYRVRAGGRGIPRPAALSVEAAQFSPGSGQGEDDSEGERQDASPGNPDGRDFADRVSELRCVASGRYSPDWRRGLFGVIKDWRATSAVKGPDATQRSSETRSKSR